MTNTGDEARRDLSVGDVVGGRWQVDRFLAAGGFGRVFAATDISSAAIGSVAVKVLLEGASTGERQGFLGEVGHMAALRHPNLVTHVDSGLLDQHEQGAVFLVTELCDESLADHLERRPGGVLVEQQLSSLLDDVSSALHHLHESGRIHRDLKPANILRSGDVWKLADFGLVRDLSASGVYHLNTVAGTPRYMAPEFFGEGQIGPSSDIWSLGVVVHQVLAGTGVHTGEGPAFVHNLASVDPVISPTLSTSAALLVQRCLARDPEARPAAADLAAILAGTDTWAPPTTPPRTTAPNAVSPVVGQPGVVTDPGSGQSTRPLPPGSTPGTPPPVPAAAPVTPGVTGQLPVGMVPGTTAPEVTGQLPDVVTPNAAASPAPAGWDARSADVTGPGPSKVRRRRTPWLVALAAIGLLLVAGGVFAASRFVGDGDDLAATGATAEDDLGPDGAATEAEADPAGPEASTDGAGDGAGVGDDTAEDDAAAGGAADDAGTDGATEASGPPSGGEAVGLADLAIGDCVDPDLVDGELELALRLPCDEPHIYEVFGLFESPDAGGEFPGYDDLFTFGVIQCSEAFKDRFGIGDPETSLQVVSYRPRIQDWEEENVFSVVCVINRKDFTALFEPIGSDIEPWLWASGDTLSFLELQVGHCFDLASELIEVGINQRVVFRDCDEPHTGEKYWNALLFDLGSADDGFPGDVVAAEADDRCHESLHEGYGEDHDDADVTSTAISPTAQEWEQFRVNLAACVVVFDEPINTTLATRINS